MTNKMNKIVNGKLIELTPKEITAFNARQPKAEDLLKEIQRNQKDVGGHIYISKPNNTGAKILFLD